MVEIGYSLSSEEFGPRELIRWAQHAEECGFRFALISDHFHPWIDRQGQSPFVWTVIGGIAQATQRLRLGTGVTCPTTRMHPAIVAQAAATAAVLMPGRFFLGIGSGENLNEHITGQRWPAAEVRLDMMEEAIAVIRLLWQGGSQSHHGIYYTLEDARLYTLPDTPPPLLIAAAAPEAARRAARLGDGLISTRAEAGLTQQFREAGGEGKPCYGQITVCWAESEVEARRTAREWWPTAAVPGTLNSELALPEDFEAVAKLITADDVAERIICGPDPKRHIDGINKFIAAGYSHVYVHQVGRDQEGFFNFYQREILPEFTRAKAQAA